MSVKSLMCVRNSLSLSLLTLIRGWDQTVREQSNYQILLTKPDQLKTDCTTVQAGRKSPIL